MHKNKRVGPPPMVKPPVPKEPTEGGKPNNMGKGKQILFGYLIAFSLWITGMLLSGVIPVIVDYMYLNTGSHLIIIFPLIVAFTFIYTAKKCAPKGYNALYISTLVSFTIPIICSVFFCMVFAIFDTMKSSSEYFDFIPGILYFPCITIGAPAISVYMGFDDCLYMDYNTITYTLLFIAYVLVAVIGAAASAIIYKKKKKQLANYL